MLPAVCPFDAHFQLGPSKALRYMPDMEYAKPDPVNLLMISMQTKAFIITSLAISAFAVVSAKEEKEMRKFDPVKDLLSLHYDHAPDKDDGHSAAADRTVLETMYGKEWIRKHVTVVSGAYGKNAPTFNPKSDAVMEAVWADGCGWLSNHSDHEKTLMELAKRWESALAGGGDVWVKEGGQSDITAAAVALIKTRLPKVETAARIHVVQHSVWNEKHSTDAALAYTRAETDYIKIPDANSYLNIKKGDAAFEAAARAHPVFAPSWKAAFDYYDPRERLDFSDTGELFHILGLGRIGMNAFRIRFLKAGEKDAPAGETK